MKLDIVIPLGIEGMHWDDNELRYSLRSIEENFKDLGKVWIVGHKPGWLVNVNHIPAADPYKTNKDANLINKIILACQEPELSESFLFTSDDHLWMQPVEAIWFERPLRDNSQMQFDRNKRLNRWQQRLVRTEIALEARLKPKDCFEAHVPYMFNKWLYTRTMMQFDYGVDIGYTLATPYYNMNGIPYRDPDENTVARLNHMPQSVHEIKDLVHDKMFFNYSTVAFGTHVKNFLAERFDKKSKFEA